MDLFNHIQTFFYYNFTFWEETWAEVKKKKPAVYIYIYPKQLRYTYYQSAFPGNESMTLLVPMIYSLSTGSTKVSFIA